MYIGMVKKAPQPLRVTEVSRYAAEVCALQSQAVADVQRVVIFLGI